MLQVIFTVIILHLIGLISPGPDFAMVLRNALGSSRQAGVYTGLGFGVAVGVHVAYCILGLAVIIEHSVLLFDIIKYLGGAYLIYLGIKALLSKLSAKKDPRNVQTFTLTRFQAFRIGFVCNLMNPKVVLSFIAIFTVAIKPITPIWLQILLGLEMMTVTFLWFNFVSHMVTHPKVLKRIDTIQHRLVKSMGVILILFGLGIIFFEWHASGDH